MYFVYILQSQMDNSFYIGSTEDIEGRLWEHNYGRTGYSKRKRPWKLVYREIFDNKTEAMKRERYIKRLKSKIYIENLINSKGP